MELDSAGFFDTSKGPAERLCPEEAESKLEIIVVFTTVPLTLAALKKSGTLASQLGARILVLVARIVPYHLPLTAPPVPLGFDESRIRRIAGECPPKTTVLLCLCRDLWQTLRLTLTPNSLVVLGVRKRWWPTRASRLARKLRRAGHEVIVVETE